jgi:hypothetical protein
LVAEAEERQEKKEKSMPKTSPVVANGVLGSTTGTVHMLLENKEKHDKHCFLCMLCWKNAGEKWVPKSELERFTPQRGYGLIKCSEQKSDDGQIGCETFLVVKITYEKSVPKGYACEVAQNSCIPTV